MFFDPDPLFCGNCGAIEAPKCITPGSFLIELVLWLCFILPGLIYSIWRLTSRYEGCPVRGQAGMVPLNSPRAKAEMKAWEISSPATLARR